MCYSYISEITNGKEAINMWYVIIFAIGVMMGSVTSNILHLKNHIGTLRIDNSDPDGTYLFLELSKDIKSFNKKKSVVLTVKDKNYISQK